MEDRLQAGEAAAVAMLVTGAAREALGACPAFGILAEEAESGKSTLAAIGEIVACGEALPRYYEAKDDKEIAKSIFSALRVGRRSISLENIENGIVFGHPVFDSLVTSDGTYTARELGGHSDLTVSANKLVIFNGNRLRLARDTATRCCVVRLNPIMTKGKRDPIEWCKQNQVAIVTAGLTIARYGLQHIDEDRAIESRFVKWERIVAHTISDFMGANPVATINEAKAESADEQDVKVLELFAELMMQFGDKPFKVGDIVSAMADGGFDGLAVKLRNLGITSTSSQGIGRALPAYVGRVVGTGRDCLKLQVTWDKDRKQNLYTVMSAIPQAA